MKLDDFTEAVRKVLLSKPKGRAKYENRKPTSEELNRRYRLVKKR
ncbi:MAG: hypothetical protein OXJ38_08355 [Gammaproteobacteria bacterium]|nr:hypothetical protein [Gammaproteobacteria bacterium]